MELTNAVGFLVALLFVWLAALRWGVDSTDGLDSSEWARRRHWPASGSWDGRTG